MCEDSCDLIVGAIANSVANALACRDEHLGRVRHGQPSRDTWKKVCRVQSDSLEFIEHVCELYLTHSDIGHERLDELLEPDLEAANYIVGEVLRQGRRAGWIAQRS